NQLKGSASAGGDEGHFVGQSGLLDRGHGIAPADDGGSARFGKRLGNRFRPGGKLLDLKNAGRSVPQDGLGARDLTPEKRDRERTDVDRLPAIRNIVVV